MKKRILTVLVAVLLVASFTACAAPTATPVPTSTPAPTAPPATPGNPQLPLVSTKVTFTLWIQSFADIATVLGGDMNKNLYWQEMEKRTNVHIEFVNPPAGQEQDNLNLIIASQKYPDLMQLGDQGYTGGWDKAISDKFIIRLNELIDQYAPNYKAAFESSPDMNRDVRTDEGNIPGFFQLAPGPLGATFYGMVVRKDWLDDLGLAIPETYDEWHTMLTAFKTQKGAVAPLLLPANGLPAFDVFTAGYDVGAAFINVGGTVKYSPIEQGYKDYLTTMHQWYVEGLIDPDFATKKEFLPAISYTTTGKTGAWWDVTPMMSMEKMMGAQKDPKYALAAVPSPAKTKGQTQHLFQSSTRTGGAFFAVTTACKDPATAVRWMDYPFSPEGSTLAMYGIEGTTYAVVDGKPQRTDLILKNPDGLSQQQATFKYLRWQMGDTLADPLIDVQPGSDNAIYDAAWKMNNDGAYIWPSKAALSTEEGAQYSQIMGDITTYVGEMTTKFIVGTEPLADYDAFVSTIKSMKIDDAIALQQGALDRYLAR